MNKPLSWLLFDLFLLLTFSLYGVDAWGSKSPLPEDTLSQNGTFERYNLTIRAFDSITLAEIFGATVLYNGLPYGNTPYVFVNYLPGIYSVQHPDYEGWMPESIYFGPANCSIEFNFYGYMPEQSFNLIIRAFDTSTNPPTEISVSANQDGMPVGTTPCTISNYTPGMYSVSDPGYIDWDPPYYWFDFIMESQEIHFHGWPVDLPYTPENLQAAAQNRNKILLTWEDHSDNEAGFAIERKTGTAGTWTQITTVGANTLSYLNMGLNQNTTYYYRVRAYNSANEFSPYSNEEYATTFNGFVINVSAKDWSENPVCGAEILRNGVPTGYVTPAIFLAAPGSYTIAHPYYTAWLPASYYIGTVTMDYSVAFRGTQVLFEHPILTQIEQSDNTQIELSWSAYPGTSYYRVFCSDLPLPVESTQWLPLDETNNLNYTYVASDPLKFFRVAAITASARLDE